MYRYDAYDHALVKARVAQFKGQTERFLAGKLTEDQFRPLRIKNYLFLDHSEPMEALGLPYG